MQKLEITVVVPERIAALVQIFLQRNAFGDSNNLFHQYLESHGVENPQEFSKEIEIGIKHPDDEPVKIERDSDYLETHYIISAFIDKYQDEIQSLIDIQNDCGMGGLWMEAESLTNEFQSKYNETAWGEELDWHDTLDQFLTEKLQ